ncbi:type II 3-dehydroquinate dehydratase [Microbacterium aurugineum]|uniref:3-dehydroquinate dehydratase n=1 Tax=Microbacterium aurugineum TaxID=2851642 RepID=A0ABY4J4B3_9MICO|nr:type II 3-dehydroquinate dehydratase [Microbacterium aurugineum]UPL19405.1 3-dehydroquinate dehydratase [Microbacterium aurugineum]
MSTTNPLASPDRRLLLLNGPNLNQLGLREPELYGTETLDDVARIAAATARALGYDIETVQSNHEGVLIDAIHAARNRVAGIVINPGGLTHSSVSLRDALSAVALPFAEVHVTDLDHREPFRRFSYLHDLAAVRVVGQGVRGYAVAVEELVALL